MRRVELDHKAKIAWVKSGDIALASFAFDHWGGANKAQMAAEAYMSDRTEDPWEMIARIDALERQVKAADALAEAVTEYVAAEEELGGSGHPEDHALIFDTWDTLRARALADSKPWPYVRRSRNMPQVTVPTFDQVEGMG